MRIPSRDTRRTAALGSKDHQVPRKVTPFGAITNGERGCLEAGMKLPLVNCLAGDSVLEVRTGKTISSTNPSSSSTDTAYLSSHLLPQSPPTPSTLEPKLVQSRSGRSSSSVKKATPRVGPRPSALTAALREAGYKQQPEQTCKRGREASQSPKSHPCNSPKAAAATAAATAVTQLSLATAALARSLERVDSTGFFELLEFPTVG